MKKIVILHLSDIHFKWEVGDNKPIRQVVLKKLVETVKNHCNEYQQPQVVAITGDIAFSGKEMEYREASVFLSDLKKILPIKTNFLIVPGNHDVNRKQIDDLFSMHTIVQNQKVDALLESKKKVEDFINVKFQAYRNFVDGFAPGLYQSQEDYFWVKNMMEHEISFLGLNSCWACEGDNDRFNIALGGPQLMEALETSLFENKIVLMHHPPFDWLKDMREGPLRNQLFKHCQLLIHGHTHIDKASVIEYPSYALISLGLNNSYAHGGNIEFQFLEVTFNGKKKPEVKVKAWPYSFDERQVHFVPDMTRYEGQKGKPFFILGSKVLSKDIPLTKTLPPMPMEYKEWIRSFHSTVALEQLARHGEAIMISLPTVYIPLETANPYYKHKREEVETEPPYIDIEKLLGRNRCMLLRGNAGMGKTTSIKHLAYSLAHECSPKGLNDHLPVMVFLREFWLIFKMALKKKNTQLTFEDILDVYLSRVHSPLTMEVVNAYLMHQQALVLIDGLDEVPHDLRPQLVDLIHRFWFKNKENAFLITSRPHGIDDRVLNFFGKYLCDIQPLKEEKINAFITRWFHAVSGQAIGVAEVNALDMIADVRHHKYVAVFTGSPLLLMALCILYLMGRRIPDQRADLYDRIVANLLYRRFHDPVEPEQVNRVLEYLMKLAFTMHRRNIRSIDAQEASEIFVEFIPSSEKESQTQYKERLLDQFRSIESASGLLNRHSNTEIEFIHLSFMEFLAAKYMLNMDISYKTFLDHPWWQETLLLYTGLMNIEMKKRSNAIAMEMLNSRSRRIQILGAEALRDFSPSKREHKATERARAVLLEIVSGDDSLEVRFNAGELLGDLGDPRIDVLNPTLVMVVAGEFTRGGDGNNDEKPIRRIELDAFEIGVFPVTNMEYRAFMEDGGYNNEAYWEPQGWQWRQMENVMEPSSWREWKWNGPNFPIVGVSWYEAYAYTMWLSQKTCHHYALPTEAQWEKAARGSKGLIYPWGNEYGENLNNSRESGLQRTSPVGIFPGGVSPYGCYDMAGNVWEWCSDWYNDKYYGVSPSENPPGPLDGSFRVIRGGNWFDGSNVSRTAYRVSASPHVRNNAVGFRLLRFL